MTKKRRRLNLELNEKVNTRLENLLKATEADSYTEVIRRALKVYDHLHACGAEVVLKFPSGEEKTVVLL